MSKRKAKHMKRKAKTKAMCVPVRFTATFYVDVKTARHIKRLYAKPKPKRRRKGAR